MYVKSKFFIKCVLYTPDDERRTHSVKRVFYIPLPKQTLIKSFVALLTLNHI